MCKKKIQNRLIYVYIFFKVYKGMDIVTNKIKHEERAQITHHMMDIIDPSEFYSVLDYRNATLPIINKLHEEEKLPVVVGGTFLYVESILWKLLLESQDVKQKPCEIMAKSYKSLQNVLSDLQNGSKIGASSEIEEASVQNQNNVQNVIQSEKQLECRVSSQSDIAFPKSDIGSTCGEISGGDGGSGSTFGTNKAEFLSSLNNISNEDLIKCLEKVDPKMASRLHPNDRRKIIR